MGTPRVFISYSHDSDAHRARVLALAERLRTDGIETELDRYVNGTPAEGWPRWMLNCLDRADRVLLVCTQTYYRRFRGHEAPGLGRGVDWEGAIITQAIYDQRSASTRFIPVLFDAADAAHIPEPVRSRSRHVLTSADGYQDLYDELLDQAGVEPGPLGEPRHRPRDRAEPLAFGANPAPDPNPNPGLPPAGRNPFLGEGIEVIGRDEALERILGRLAAGNHCSLVGPPGSGKSALLRALEPRLGTDLGWSGRAVLWLSLRTIVSRGDLQGEIIARLGGGPGADWRGLLRADPPRLLVLDDLGGMAPGAGGHEMRRWLRGLTDDPFRIRLLPVSIERLDVQFRRDIPRGDSPLAGLDPAPVSLAPLAGADCRRLVATRLDGTGIDPDRFADLCAEPRQPGALLAACAARFEALWRASQGAGP